MLLLALACSADPVCQTGERLAANGECVAAGAPKDDSGSPDTADTDTADTDTADTDTADTDSGADDTGESPDADADGVTVRAGDCDDGDPGRYPGASEACDGVDQDCDGVVPPRESTDADGDGELACVDCDDLDTRMQVGDGSCGAYTFPLGFMSVEDSADLAELATRGITAVHAYNFGPWPGSDVATDLAWSLAYLEEAEANGLTVMANLNGRTRAERGASLDDFRTFVDGVAAAPALGSWYLADEPEYSIIEDQLFEMQGVLRDRTPDLDIQVAHCWCTDWWSFWNVGDVRMPDFYGIVNEGEPSPNTLYHPTLASYQRTYYTESRIAPVMQAFNYSVYSAEDPVTYPPDSRFPTRGELRFWAFSDLTLGVSGLWWWSWYRANEAVGGEAWLEDTFWPHLEEVRTFLAEALPAGQPVSVNPGPYDILDYTYLAYWSRPNATLVVATNGSASPRALDIQLGTTFASAALEGWDASTASVVLDAEGAATVEAEPYAVFIWRVVE
ncbi:MAG: putative metal-binding motif-containing protein [Myxococcota bacterium]